MYYVSVQVNWLDEPPKERGEEDNVKYVCRFGQDNLAMAQQLAEAIVQLAMASLIMVEHLTKAERWKEDQE